MTFITSRWHRCSLQIRTSGFSINAYILINVCTHTHSCTHMDGGTLISKYVYYNPGQPQPLKLVVSNFSTESRSPRHASVLLFTIEHLAVFLVPVLNFYLTLTLTYDSTLEKLTVVLLDRPAAKKLNRDELDFRSEPSMVAALCQGADGVCEVKQRRGSNPVICPERKLR